MNKPKLSSDAARRLDAAHYMDARLYNHRYKRRKLDLDFYRRHAVGQVLELGSGTGRVTQVLCETAKSLVAVELAKSLAEQLERQALPNVRVLCADMMTLRFRPRSFDRVVAPFHVFSHVGDGVELVALLKQVRKWLRPRGRLVFDVPNPNVRMLGWPAGKTFRLGSASDGAGGKFRYSESFTWLPREQRQLVVATYESDKAGETFNLPLLHRHYFPAELDTLLRLAGFSVEQHDGDFAGGALDTDSEEQVVVAA